jgi:hypothetical protein
VPSQKWESLWGYYSLRAKPVLARPGEAFTPLAVIFLSAFIDLTHEKDFSLWKLV